MSNSDGDLSDFNILDFPEEVTHHIFSFLTAVDLSDRTAKVCTLWREYSSSIHLWRRLEYTVDEVRSKQELVSVFQTASAFRKLTLKDCTCLECLLPLLLSNCTSVHELVISDEAMDPAVLSRLSSHYQGSIRSLALEGMKLDNSWYSAISFVARHLNSLTLKADCCVWAMGLLAVECTALISLRLSSFCQTENHHRLTQRVKQMLLLLPDGLKILQLGAQISPNTEILQAVGEKIRLQTLSLEDCCEVKDGDLFNIIRLHHLQCLQLWRAHCLTASGLLCFIQNSHFLCLKHLDLFDCPNLDDEALQEISIKCHQLETLDVSSCHLLTDCGIFSVFQFCSRLHTLKMSHLPQPTGNGYLENLPTFLPNLVYLDVYNCCSIPCNLLSRLENSKLIVMFGKRGRRF